MLAVGSDARITKIVVDHGEIIDQFVITYQTPSGTQVRTHGQGGGVVTTINFSRWFPFYFHGKDT